MTLLVIEVGNGSLYSFNDQFRCESIAISTSGDKNMPDNERAK